MEFPVVPHERSLANKLSNNPVLARERVRDARYQGTSTKTISAIEDLKYCIPYNTFGQLATCSTSERREEGFYLAFKLVCIENCRWLAKKLAFVALCLLFAIPSLRRTQPTNQPSLTSSYLSQNGIFLYSR